MDFDTISFPEILFKWFTFLAEDYNIFLIETGT